MYIYLSLGRPSFDTSSRTPFALEGLEFPPYLYSSIPDFSFHWLLFSFRLLRSFRCSISSNCSFFFLVHYPSRHLIVDHSYQLVQYSLVFMCFLDFVISMLSNFGNWFHILFCLWLFFHSVTRGGVKLTNTSNENSFETTQESLTI